MSLEKIGSCGTLETPQPSFHALVPLYPALSIDRENTVVEEKLETSYREKQMI
jgi:hypothetical protein